MKLSIGKNIKHLRKEKDITQEQLAEKLGVSYQSVSRWENETCYPDIELIPAIAFIFSVTVDELMSYEEYKKFNSYKELTKELNEACENDKVEDIIKILREIRTNHVRNLNYWFFEALTHREIYVYTEILEEVKSFMSYLIDTSAESHIVEAAERIMLLFDEHDTSIYALNDPSRREPDEAELKRRERMYVEISNVLNNDWRYWTVDYPIPQYWLWSANVRVNLINSFCYQIPKANQIISGNGEPDIFFPSRIWLGLHYACYLSVLYDHDRAFEILEDTISLLEKVMVLPEGTVLTSTSPALDGMTATIADITFTNEDGTKSVVIGKCMQIGDVTYTAHCGGVLRALTDTKGWQWFNPLREDVRYQSYIDRVKALVPLE